ncbi:polyamine aminopropyltransferase [Methylobacillus flagellatus]|uniref:polyamine aminopropyltransferase n=1 Tax=Methylobacillus flagellatus TaxID=405 RepID=UPI0010F6450F|nr:polyamine aminopropyltransferase [Methylobacillus flagellatus]
MFSMGRRIHRDLRNKTADNDSVDVSELNGIRSLHLGTDTIQSSMRVKAPYDLELTYTRGMMMFLPFVDEVRDVLLIGLGGGSIAKFIYHYLPAMRTTAVEINSRVIATARSHFYLPDDDARLRVIEGDGIAHVMNNPNSCDVLMLDAFGSDGIAEAMCSQGFFDHCAAALTRNGVCMVNLWGSDPNFELYRQRIALSFEGRALVLPTGRPGNIVVMGFRQLPAELRWTSLRDRARTLQVLYKIEFVDFIEKLRDHNPGTAHRLQLGVEP